MPISIAELQQAAEPLISRIFRFLRAHPDQAFSVLEIIEAVEEIAANLEAFTHALHQLEFDHVILSADHGGTRYYGLDPVRNRMTAANIRHLNVLLKLVELAPDPRSEPLSEALLERLRWERGAGAPSFWRLVRETAPVTQSTRELIEEQYERGA